VAHLFVSLLALGVDSPNQSGQMSSVQPAPCLVPALFDPLLDQSLLDRELLDQSLSDRRPERPARRRPEPAAAPRLEGPRRPFVKWAGGKRQLLPELLRCVPERYGRYYEPFVGGGALFFELQPAQAFLTDVNQRLIRTYRGVRDHVERVIALLDSYPHDEKFFYELRDVDIDTQPDAEVAAWFIYLNKVGFNGLYRVNRKNRFNVPFGRHKNPTISDVATLRACSAALAGATLEVADFGSAAQAVAGDLVYFDPPYVPLSVTSSFTSYTSDGFGYEAQVRLRDLALELKQRGVHVVLSNSSADLVRGLYSHAFETTEVSATRLVNSKVAGRGAITELVIR
jgi:DNA adenine methylase